MRISLSFLVLVAAALVSTPAPAQTPAERMSACEPGAPGLALVGTVTDAETGRPLHGAVVIVDDYPLGSADSVGCYTVIGADEIVGGRRPVTVHVHRYQAPDTVVEISADRSDTVHFALRPTAPGCCRLEGEWSIRLALDDRGGTGINPRADEVEGRMVFSDRLPSWGDEEETDSHTERGRFDVDLGTFFGGPYAQDVSTTTFGPVAGDFFRQAVGEVLADDSVMMVMIPRMSHGGLSMAGTIRGDTVRGQWVQNAYCCGARGRFVMHRVPASPAGEALVARALRADVEMREAANEAQAARARRVGFLRLRVFDEGSGRYARVAFTALGHEDNPQGATVNLSYSSGEDGWSREYELVPGRYDLFVNNFPCRGELEMADDDYVRMPRFTVTIEPGRRVDEDIRLDLCSLKRYDGVYQDDEEPGGQ
ncbi:MAG TPA: hypothetical protein VHG08_22135 [Longimicrobium sp.]|nr:hypothetical protein [Longimicrobium sp.]